MRYLTKEKPFWKITIKKIKTRINCDGSYDSVPVKSIHIGDVVVYNSGLVAIYVGDGKVVYASKKEGRVCSGSLKMEKIRAIKHFIDFSNSVTGLG